MPDISMCNGIGCRAKLDCYRHTAVPKDFGQSWMVPPVFDRQLGCDMYIDNFGKENRVLQKSTQANRYEPNS